MPAWAPIAASAVGGLLGAFGGGGGGPRIENLRGTSSTTFDPRLMQDFRDLYRDTTLQAGEAFQPYDASQRFQIPGAIEQEGWGRAVQAARGGAATDAIQGGLNFTSQAGNYSPMQVQAPNLGPAAQATVPGMGPGGTGGMAPPPEVRAGRATSAAGRASSTGYDPTAAGAGTLRGAVRDVDAQTGAAGMAAYQNPYQQQVIDATMADLDRARQMTMANTAGQAAGAGAWGGSRHGVMDAQTNERFLDQVAQTSAQLRSEGFNTAAANAQQDASRFLQAGGMNQGADQNALGISGNIGMANADAATRVSLANADAATRASLANASNQTQASMANARNALNFTGQQLQGNEMAARMAMFNAGQANDMARFGANLDFQGQTANQGANLSANAQRLGAGAQMGALGGQLFNTEMGYAGALERVGATQRDLNQRQRDFDYQQWMQAQQHPWQGLQARLGVLNAMPQGRTTRTSQGTIVPGGQNRAAGFLGGAATGLGLYNSWQEGR